MTPTPEGKHQVDAFTQRFSRTIGIFIVPMPDMGTPSPGTGFLAQFRGKRYFITALHNFFYDEVDKDRDRVMRLWEATRFLFRDESTLQSVESQNQAAARAKSEYGTTLPLPLFDGLLIDAKHDLIAVRMDRAKNEIAHTVSIDLETEGFTRELTTGLSLLMFGAPLSGQVDVPGAGPTLIPYLDHVRFASDLDLSGLSHDSCRPEYFFMPFSLTQDEIEPHGFSGAPVFVNKEPSPGGIWTATPHVVGVAQLYFRSKKLIRCVKTTAIIELLKTDQN